MTQRVCGIVFGLSSSMTALAGFAMASPYQDLSLDKATELAAAQGKRVAVVFVTTDKFSSCMDDALALPVLEQWRKDQVVLVRVEIEKERMAARLLGVSSVPTLVVTGSQPLKRIGCPDEGGSEQWAANLLLGKSAASHVNDVAVSPPVLQLGNFSISDFIEQGQQRANAIAQIDELCEHNKFDQAAEMLTQALAAEQGTGSLIPGQMRPSKVLDLIEEVCEEKPDSSAKFVPVIQAMEDKLRSGEPTEEQVGEWIWTCVSARQYDRVVAWYDRILKSTENERGGFAWSDVAEPLAIALAHSGRWESASKLGWLSFNRVNNELRTCEAEMSRYRRFDSKEIPGRTLKKIDRLARRYAVITAAKNYFQRGQEAFVFDTGQTREVRESVRIELARAHLQAGIPNNSCLELLKDNTRPEAKLLIEQLAEAIKKNP